MKPGVFIVFLAVVLASGCQHPTEVKVQTDGSVDPIVVSPISVPDTATYQGQLDSVAVTPEDQKHFGGFVLVTRATFDVGATVVTKTWSTVMFGSSDSTVQDGGKTIGYFGLSLGPSAALSFIRVNGLLMLPVIHSVRVSAGTKVAGVEYYRDLSSILTRFDTTFVWRATNDVLGISDVSIEAPPHLNVKSPRGGSILSRDKDLSLEWTASGKVTIFLNRYDPILQRTWPVMQIEPEGDHGRSVLPAKLLHALSRGYYVMTFTRVNRKVGIPVARYPQSVLAQAASVYNCYVELR